MASSAPDEREEESGEAAGVRVGVRHPLNEAEEQGNAPTTPGANGGCGLDSRGGCGRREMALTRGPDLSAAVEREGRAATVAARVGRPRKGRGGGRAGRGNEKGQLGRK